MKAYKLSFVGGERLTLEEGQSLVSSLKNTLIMVLDIGVRVDIKEDRELRKLFAVIEDNIEASDVTISVEQYNLLKKRWEANLGFAKGIGYMWRDALDSMVLNTSEITMKEG